MLFVLSAAACLSDASGEAVADEKQSAEPYKGDGINDSSGIVFTDRRRL